MELKEALEVLEKSGTTIDPILKKFAQENEWANKKIKEVWRCQATSCKREYYSDVHLQAVECTCGHAMKRVWRGSTAS